LLIKRERLSSDSVAHYDVVSRNGTLVRRIETALNVRIVGFGAGSVYLATEDNDGLVTLGKSSWR